MSETPLTREILAGMIDHALLRPEATPADLRAACELCAEWKVFCLCVRPCDVTEAKTGLLGTGVRVGTVAGFPLGASHMKVKAAEAAQAVADGADEIDMVLNIGRLRSGDVDYVRTDIAAVVAAAGGRCVKVILETCYLDQEQKIAACEAAVRAGAQFVKTSTGLAGGGATVEDIRLMRRCVGPNFGVKAAGGIRTLSDAQALIAAGANRLGTSRTAEILRELPA